MHERESHEDSFSRLLFSRVENRSQRGHAAEPVVYPKWMLYPSAHLGVEAVDAVFDRIKLAALRMTPQNLSGPENVASRLALT